MSVSGACLVFFNDPDLAIDDAERALREAALAVTRDGDCPTVRWSETSGPELELWLSREPHVALEALELAEMNEELTGLAACDARFEVMLPDVEQVLDETNTLAEVEMTLQSLSRGFIHRSWNGILSGPPAES